MRKLLDGRLRFVTPPRVSSLDPLPSPPLHFARGLAT